MKTFYRLTGISFLVLSFLSPCHAENCNSVVKEIYDLSMGKPDSKVMPPWQNLAWLQKTLGPETVLNNSQTYTWDNFTIIIETDKTGQSPTVKTLGDSAPIMTALHKTPDPSKLPTVEQVTSVLGKPNSIAVTKIYSWNCKATPNNTMSIKVTADTKNNITQYDGFYCTTTKCNKGDDEFSLDASDIDTILKTAGNPTVEPVAENQ